MPSPTPALAKALDNNLSCHIPQALRFHYYLSDKYANCEHQ